MELSIKIFFIYFFFFAKLEKCLMFVLNAVKFSFSKSIINTCIKIICMRIPKKPGLDSEKIATINIFVC